MNKLKNILTNKLTWITLAFIAWTWVVGTFFANNYLQFPFVITTRCLVCSRHQVSSKPKTTSKTAQKRNILIPTKTIERTEKEIVMEQKHGEILWKIYQLETERGKTDGCRKEGKFGGFGVMSYGQVVCYDSFEEAVERAEYWLSRLNPDKNLVGAICQWNTGNSGAIDCNYWRSYQSL